MASAYLSKPKCRSDHKALVLSARRNNSRRCDIRIAAHKEWVDLSLQSSHLQALASDVASETPICKSHAAELLKLLRNLLDMQTPERVDQSSCCASHSTFNGRLTLFRNPLAASRAVSSRPKPLAGLIKVTRPTLFPPAAHRGATLACKQFRPQRNRTQESVSRKVAGCLGSRL